MPGRLIEPVPDRVRALPADRRRALSKAVRSGEPVAQRRDARAAVEFGEWMVRQLDTSYVDMVTSWMSIGAIGILAVLGYVQTATPLGAGVNVLPWFAILFLFRLGARWIFRNAPAGLQANRDVLAGKRPPAGSSEA